MTRPPLPIRLRAALAALLATLLGACATVPDEAPPVPRETAQEFAARRLDQAAPELPPAAAGWDRAQWLTAALALNPQLAEARAEALTVAARQRTAAQLPNPTLNLFGEYIAAAAGGSGWLYGLSLDFLLQRPGERSRARRSAALQAQAAQADVAQAIWQVRASLRLALLDAVAAEDEASLLQQLVAQRQALLASARIRAASGEIAAAETPRAALDLAGAGQRLQDARTRAADARARLAGAVGVPLEALRQIPLRWPQWSDIGELTVEPAAAWRDDALVARPELVRALREYDLAELRLQDEVAKRWPQLHLSPGYAWDRGGVQENQLHETLHDNELGLSLELPLFNRNEGPIAEAAAARHEAALHLLAVQAGLFSQIERAEQGWPQARQSWRSAADSVALAQRQEQAEQRALAAGASDRPSGLLAAIAATEAQLLGLRAAYEAQLALGALEDAYRRPLDGPECALPQRWRAESAA